jgi:hypothetical protein
MTTDYPQPELVIWPRNESEAIEQALRVSTVRVGEPTLDEIPSRDGFLPFRFSLFVDRSCTGMHVPPN